MDTSNFIDNGDGTFTDPSSGDVYSGDGALISSGTNPNTSYQGTGSSAASGGGEEPAPPGAVAQSNGNWIDAAGKILGPIVTSALTPYLNNLQSGGLLSTGTDMLKNAGNALNGVNAPDLTKLIPQLRLQVMQGSMTPAQAAAAVQEASRMGSVQTDQASLQGQRAALGQLANIGANNGMTEADRAALNATMNQTNANAAQQRAAMLQQLQMQGNAGTGAELASRLSGVQGGANANAAAGASTAQAAQARALQAIQANLQGNAALNTQQFSQEAQKAQAQDAVNNFNAQARQAANLANAGYTQQAGLTNFDTANKIAATNTGIQNQQAMMPYNATQSNFENQLGLGKAKSATQVAAGTPLVKAATEQIGRSAGAGAASAAANGSGTAGTGSSGGGSVDPITGAITGAIKSGIGSAITNGLGDVASTVGGWLGFKEGGYVGNEAEHGMSDQDIDHLIAHMTAYKYRRKV